MRRKDREMDESFGFDVIDQANFGVVSLVGSNGEPISVPLSIVRKERHLFFHSSTSGEKVEQMPDGKRVSVAFVTDVHVPDLYPEEELNQLSESGDLVSVLGLKVFTTEFASAIVRGRVFKELNDTNKKEALRLLCERFVPGKMKFFEAATGDNLDMVAIYRIEIESLTAKRKKFGADREELKFQRME